MTVAEARRILGVDETASPPQLRSAYRMRLKLWHPDRFALDSVTYPEAVLHTQRINAAYRTLRDRGRAQGCQTTVATGSHSVHRGGASIRTVEWRWWPLRVLASEETSVWTGALVFAMMWAILVGLALTFETLLR